MFWHGLTCPWPNQDNLATDDPYQFQPLSASTTIRLIKIFPKKIKGCIACRIFHFNEKQQGRIKYHALSYVWGDAESTRQIYLQDQGNGGWRPFPLHENLWQFLDRTWRSKRFRQFFWTDYLCLDQNGHEEISQQVPRMHAIYRNAELVVIWLQLKEEEQKGLRKVVRWFHPKLKPKVLRRVFKERLFLYRDAIRAAMENPYWSRIWIVQEVVVTKKVCVTTGAMSIDLDDLRFLVDSIIRRRFWNLGPSLWELCDMRAVGGKIPLWRMLRDFGEYQSSRPGDRVFGMLGMVEDHEDGSSPVENIQVDYDKPIFHVLLDAMLESLPPLTEYRMTILRLGHEEFFNGFSLLKRYIGEISTTERHRDFAKIALQAFEVFSIIKSARDGHHGDYTPSVLECLFSSVAKTDWRPTLRQSAALVGLMLSNLNREALPKGMIHIPTQRSDREWILPAQPSDRGRLVSPWRCAAHESHDGDNTRLGSYELVASAFTWDWDCEYIVHACGQQSQSCIGSIMACEISDIGLRLQVESWSKFTEKDTCHLSLYSLKTETGSEDRAGGDHK